MSDDWEYSESDCPKCKSQLSIRTCGSCGGEGYFDDDDLDWGGVERCDICNGRGHEEWCRECGWDMNFNCFMSPEYQRVWEAKQANQ